MWRDPTNLRGGEGRRRGMAGVWETNVCEMVVGVISSSSGGAT